MKSFGLHKPLPKMAFAIPNGFWEKLVLERGEVGGGLSSITTFIEEPFVPVVPIQTFMRKS